MARRVIIVGPAHPLRGGGMSTFNERLALAFQEAGDEVEIVSFSLQYPSFLFPGKSQFTNEPAPEGLTALSRLSTPLTQLVGSKQATTFAGKSPTWLFSGSGCLLWDQPWARLPASSAGTGIAAYWPLPTTSYRTRSGQGDVPLTKYFLSACHGFLTMSRAVQQDLSALSSLLSLTYTCRTPSTTTLARQNPKLRPVPPWA
jgi:D-inositol-3-phosphate glycosyltransferase